MKLLQKTILVSWDKLLALLGASAVLLPVSPANMSTALRDSGVFLYIGWRILNGATPYKDIWDHKPPVIYYINAVGLSIANNSRWGVWGLELISLFIAAWIGFHIVKILFGVVPAFFSMLLWLLALVQVLQGGNFTTEYTLPLQFMALWLVLNNGWDFKPIHYFFLGVTGALSFLTKQTTIGVWAAIILAISSEKIIIGQIKEHLKSLLPVVIGFSIATLIVLTTIIKKGAIEQFWNAAFEFNYHYALINSDGSFLSWYPRTLINGLKPLTKSGLLQISLLGYLFCVAYLSINNFPKTLRPILLTAIINLPIELFLLGISDKTYPHYFMTLLPVLSIFSGHAIWVINTFVLRWNSPKYLIAILVVIFTGVILERSFYNYLDQLYIYRRHNPYEATLNYIQNNTDSDDYVLQIGNEAGINFFASRTSPTRFIYQKPLRWQGYVTENYVNEFLEDIIQQKPKLIIHTTPSTPMFEFPVTNEAINQKISQVQLRYCAVQEIDNWIIYQYSDEGCEN